MFLIKWPYLFYYSSRMFFDTRTDPTCSWYSPEFFHFSVITKLRPFSGTHRDNFSILTRILPFQILPWTVFRYSHGSTFSGYSPGFYHISIFKQIRPFFGTRRDSFSILERILHFPGTHPDCTIFRYSHRFDPFPVLTRTVFRYSYGFYLLPVLSWILLFFGTHTDWTLFRYSSGQFFDTRTDSTFSRYWPEWCHFRILKLGRASCRERV